MTAVSVPILNVISFRLGLRPRLGDGAAAQRPGQVIAAVPGLPMCAQHAGVRRGRLVPKYLCLDSVDRYVLTYLARDFGRAQQQLAAQYRAPAG